jgi:iron complex transport system substrate-binding protein
VQAEIAKELIRRGVTVFAFNQRSVAQIFDMIATLARIVGKEREGLALIARFERGLEETAQAARQFPHRPRVYFEEWNDPLISGIEWVEQLIDIAGGDVIFPELRGCGKAQDRVVSSAVVIERNPEVILASWCGKKVDVASIAARPGWTEVSAVRNGHIYEIDSTIILQPGPAALTDGVRAIHGLLANLVVSERASGAQDARAAASVKLK